LIQLLDEHREHTRSPGSVFAGGAFDQIAGSWLEIGSTLVKELPQLIKALKAGDKRTSADLLTKGQSVSPENWHPAAKSALAYPLWAFAVCAVAISQSNRIVRSEFGARRQVMPGTADVKLLSSALIGSSTAISDLEELLLFLRLLVKGDVEKLAVTGQPNLLSLSEPCSWISDLYNTLTTNSSHNPLNGPMLRWLQVKHPKHVWQGWPSRRSVSVSAALGSDSGRRQWQLIGTSKVNPNVIAVEVKSITGNHWGDKSKEIYDRVAETRAACSSMSLSLVCIGILDGDFGSDQFGELRTGIGYDETYSITEVLGM